MSEKIYQQIIAWAEAKPYRKSLLCHLNHGLPICIGIVYGIYIVLCLWVYPVLLTDLVLRPALCFLFITVLRKILKHPRPYDKYDFIPLCDYHPGKNQSFPSRHTGSAAIIALEIFRLSSTLGPIMLVLAFMVGLLRIICGNHFIKDVVSAYIFAFICYII